jgi:hypothetical protein
MSRSQRLFREFRRHAVLASAHTGLALAAVALALLTGGCSMMQSTLPDLDAGAEKLGCTSNAGSYYLPKTMLRLGIIKRTIDANPSAVPPTEAGASFELSYLVALRRSDSTKPYCLDYLKSITSDDNINIVKYSSRLSLVRESSGAFDLDKSLAKLPSPYGSSALDKKRILTIDTFNAQVDSNLLRYVSTDALDQSSYIAKALIKTLFLGVAGASSGVKSAGLAAAEGKEQRVAEMDFDPFDPFRTAVINDAIKDFGFCILIEGGTLDPEHGSIQHYCDAPMKAVTLQPDFNARLEAARSHTEVKDVRGILYRPRIPYRVMLFLKQDLGKPRGWTLRKSEVLAMENIAPVIAIQVDRTFFAQRKTALVFDQGTLTNICIYKGSELQKFVEVPLEIVKGVVALPTQIIQLRLINTNNETQLVKMHDAVLRRQGDVSAKLGELSRQVKDPRKQADTKDIFLFNERQAESVAEANAFYKTNYVDNCPPAIIAVKP